MGGGRRAGGGGAGQPPAAMHRGARLFAMRAQVRRGRRHAAGCWCGRGGAEEVMEEGVIGQRGVTAYIKGASCSRNERRCRCAALLGKLTDCVGAMIAMTGCLWTPACARGRFFRLIVLPTVCTSVWGLGCLSFAAAHHPLLTGCRAGCALRQSRLTSRLPPRCCSPPTRCWCGDGGACGLFSRGTRPFGGRPPRRPCRPPRMVTASGGAWPRPRRHRLRTVLGRLPNLGARAGVKTAGILLCKEAAA